MCSFELSCSAVSEPLQPHGLQPPGSSVHGILQANILERVLMPSSKGSSLPSEPPGKTMNTGVGSLCLCWRRLLRVPWTTRRANQSILKEISPEYSLKQLTLKLKLQCFGHLMQRTDSLEKTLMLGKIEGRRRRE